MKPFKVVLCYSKGMLLHQSRKSSDNFPDATILLQLNNPWLVSFDSAKRGPAQPVVFNELSDWSLNSNDMIKNYSGTAVYQTSFKAGQMNKGEKDIHRLWNG